MLTLLQLHIVVPFICLSQNHFLCGLLKNFRKGKWITTLIEKSLREKHQGLQGLQNQPLDLEHPTMKILCHQALVIRGMMEMHIHLLSLVLTF
jgi:hypothetical protein